MTLNKIIQSQSTDLFGDLIKYYLKIYTFHLFLNLHYITIYIIQLWWQIINWRNKYIAIWITEVVSIILWVTQRDPQFQLRKYLHEEFFY